MNNFQTLLFSLLCGAAALKAQDMPAATSVWANVGGVTHLLCVRGNSLSWTSESGVDEIGFALPFTRAGQATHIGNNNYVVSGWDDQGDGRGVLLRIELRVPSGIPQITVVETLDLGEEIRPSGVSCSAIESALIVLDRSAGKFHYMPWVPWQPFGQLSPALTFTVQAGSPWEIRQGLGGLTGESTDTVYAFSDEALANIVKRHRLYRASPISVWQLETIDLHSSFGGSSEFSTGWHIRGHDTQSSEGTLSVAAWGGGSFSVVRQSDQVVVLTGVCGAGPGYTDFTLPTGTLSVGEEYRVSGGGQIASRSFFPTYRRGALLPFDELRFQKWRLEQDRLTVGAQAFKVWGRLEWLGQSDFTAAAIPYFLWVTVGEPGPGVTADLPDGRSIITNPALLFTGEEPIRVARIPGYLPVRQAVDIPDWPELEGLPILFQWLAITPQGNIIVSDVYGAKIKAAPGGASMLMSSGAGGGSGSVSSGAGMRGSAQVLTPIARCRNWLESLNKPGWMIRRAILTNALLSQSSVLSTGLW